MTNYLREKIAELACEQWEILYHEVCDLIEKRKQEAISHPDLLYLTCWQMEYGRLIKRRDFWKRLAHDDKKLVNTIQRK